MARAVSSGLLTPLTTTETCGTPFVKLPMRRDMPSAIASAMGSMYRLFVSGTTAPPVAQFATASMPSSPIHPWFVSVGPVAM